MRRHSIRTFLLAAGCIALLSGCTKSNIVRPEMAESPDFNIYTDIELDEEQLKEDVDEIYLDETDYPMGYAIDFKLYPRKDYVTVAVVVKDGTSPEDAAYFADVAVKGINDQAAVQDFSYEMSGEESFGGFYLDKEIRLKIYRQSEYEAKGAPMYETTVPKGTYMTFEIKE